jgi:hypothetical protein
MMHNDLIRFISLGLFISALLAWDSPNELRAMDYKTREVRSPVNDKRSMGKKTNPLDIPKTKHPTTVKDLFDYELKEIGQNPKKDVKPLTSKSSPGKKKQVKPEEPEEPEVFNMEN